jgi:demethylmenaquinone methyltransferase/2-methoxy-6-polyprenyl-1,4-benzoquinol methylase
MANVNTPAPGTRPEGILDERAASAYVRRMFSQIAPRYDLLNHLLSFNLDRFWRARTARRFAHILCRPEARVLDLCCGTGDLLLALVHQAARAKAQSTPRHGGHGEAGSPRAQAGLFVGCDFAHPMLTRASEKARLFRGTCAPAPAFSECDALQLPFADASFDLVTAAFGLRNLANYEAGLREILRVLKPGGEAGILEFAAPRNSFCTRLYNLYFTRLVPCIGGAISGSDAAYAYLPASVSKFPSMEELARLMHTQGFAEARFEAWMMGTVGLHRARKA